MLTKYVCFAIYEQSLIQKVCNIWSWKCYHPEIFFPNWFMYASTHTISIIFNWGQQSLYQTYYHFHIHLYILEMIPGSRGKGYTAKIRCCLNITGDVDHLLVFLILKIEYYLFYSVIALEDCIKKNQNIGIHFTKWLIYNITGHVAFDASGIWVTVLAREHLTFTTNFAESTYWVKLSDAFSHQKLCKTNCINSPNTTGKWMLFIIIKV